MTKEEAVSAESVDIGENRLKGLEYDPKYARQDSTCRYMKEIQEMAVSGKTIIDAMGTKMAMPNWDDILILGEFAPFDSPHRNPADEFVVVQCGDQHLKRLIVIGLWSGDVTENRLKQRTEISALCILVSRCDAPAGGTE